MGKGPRVSIADWIEPQQPSSAFTPAPVLTNIITLYTTVTHSLVSFNTDLSVSTCMCAFVLQGEYEIKSSIGTGPAARITVPLSEQNQPIVPPVVLHYLSFCSLSLPISQRHILRALCLFISVSVIVV